MAPTRADADATMRLVLLDAITETCHLTRLRAGPEVDALLNALVKATKDPSTRWAFEFKDEET